MTAPPAATANSATPAVASVMCTAPSVEPPCGASFDGDSRAATLSTIVTGTTSAPTTGTR